MMMVHLQLTDTCTYMYVFCNIHPRGLNYLFLENPSYIHLTKRLSVHRGLRLGKEGRRVQFLGSDFSLSFVKSVLDCA